MLLQDHILKNHRQACSLYRNMDYGGRAMYDDRLQSIITNVTDRSVMPAATAQVRMHNAAVESRDLQKDGISSQYGMHAQYVLQLLQLQRQAGFLCDITIHVKDRSFKAHKPLLAACSLYFRSLFSDPNTKESTALNLVPLTPTGFEVLLDYIYSGNLAITAENCSAVLSAAICLQMTNVVETCKKFMQSSFQMTSCKEPAPLSNFHRDSSNENTFLKINHSQQYEEKESSTKFLRSSSMELPNAPDRTHLRNQTSKDIQSNIEAHQQNLPSATQLQSVLPILMTNYPRQPTPKEVQKILASYPNAKEILAKYSNLTSSFKNLADQDIPSLKSTENQNSTSASLYLTANPTTSTHLVHNGLVSRSNSLHGASFATDLSTPCPAASSTKTAEHGSGYARTSEYSGYKNDKPNHLKERRSSSTLQPTTEETSNSIEISSDEESESTAWSADKSAPLPSDLSGTPCKATTPTFSTQQSQSRSADPVNLSAGQLNERLLPNSQSGLLKTPVVKTLSLPSLSENTPVKPLSRARSAENNGDSSCAPGSNVCASPTSAPDPAKEIIPERAIKIEYDDTKIAPAMPERLYASEQASDTLSPLNESEPSPYSADCSTDDNTALDLTVSSALDANKRVKMADQAGAALGVVRRSESESHAKNSSRRSSAASSFSDPGMQLAVDALEMLKQSKANEAGYQLSADCANASVVSSDSNSTDLQENQREAFGWDEENINVISVSSLGSQSKQAMFSRKPRRTTDGQMCTWPGCKQLFRNRNNYEEHMKMHKRGTPAAQLRKCYMGARVKKTVREQLEELRTSDSVFDGAGESDTAKSSRPRKRKSNSDSHEPLRKRVNVKDRVGHIQFAPALAPHSSIVRKPLHQVLLSSKSPTSREPPSTFLRPPALIPSYAANPRHDMRLSQPGDMPTSPTISQPPGLTMIGSPYSLVPNPGRSPTNRASTYSRIALGGQRHLQEDPRALGPIKATLALLGIQTPLRSNEFAMLTSSAASPIEQLRRTPSYSEAAIPKLMSEPIAHPTHAFTPLSSSSGETVSERQALGGDGGLKDGTRFTSDASSASSGSPPACVNNTNPSVTLNR